MIKVEYGDTDAELAATMQELTMALNAGAGMAKQRELIVTYDIRTPYNCNPRLSTKVLMEVA